MNLFTKQKSTHRHRKQTYGCQRGKGVWINQEFGIKIYTLLYIKQITNKDLLYSTGNYIQYLVITYSGRECKKRIYIFLYTCITESLCCVPETNTTTNTTL